MNALKKIVGPVGPGLLVLALVAGCSDGDDPAGPTPTTQLSGPQAEEWTVQALTAISDMAASVDEWAAADFSGLSAGAGKAPVEEPTWDEGEQAWVLSYEGPLFAVEPPNTWTFRLDYWIQYRSGGSPVALPEAADAFEVRMSTGMTVHAEEEGSVSDLDYDFVTQMVVTGLGGDAYGVSGTGSSLVDVAQTSPQGSVAATFAMDWEMDLSVPADGSCPSGTAEVTAPGFTLDAVYDGQGQADWTLVGDGYEASGTEILDCGAAVTAKR